MKHKYDILIWVSLFSVVFVSAAISLFCHLDLSPPTEYTKKRFDDSKIKLAYMYVGDLYTTNGLKSDEHYFITLTNNDNYDYDLEDEVTKYLDDKKNKKLYLIGGTYIFSIIDYKSDDLKIEHHDDVNDFSLNDRKVFLTKKFVCLF